MATISDLCANFSSIVRVAEDASDLEEVKSAAQRLLVEVDDRARIVKSSSTSAPAISSWDDTLALGISVMNPRAPWLLEEKWQISIPCMITGEEKQYYCYVTRFYKGIGEVVELGPWLGASTNYIMRGLKRNPNFSNKKLHVFDDFVWRSAWMDDHVMEKERLPNHSNFKSLFEKYTSEISDDLLVYRNKISSYDGNESLPPIEWHGGAIELMFIDCGRSYEANQAWYQVFMDSFIPGRTLLVMQDWRLHREVPFRWYNQTHQFTESKGSSLNLIHEVLDGGIATFLFAG